MRNKGLLIVFDGIDGCGKGTQIEYLVNALEDKYTVDVFREPGGTAIGEQIRNILLDKNNTEMRDISEMYLYATSRIQLAYEKIIPALEAGHIVILDRFYYSSIAYQGYGKCDSKNILPLSEVMYVNRLVINMLQPDVTFLLDIHPEVSKQRLNDKEKDRMELKKIEYFAKVRNGYLNMASSYNEIVTINGDDSILDIKNFIRKYIKTLILKHEDAVYTIPYECGYKKDSKK